MTPLKETAMYVDIAHRDEFGRVAGYAGRMGSKLILSTLASSQPFWIGREFDAIAALCPRVEKPALHIVLTPHASAELSDYEFVLAILWLCERLGISGNQLVAWRHDDVGHPHVHILANRVSPQGKTTSIWAKGRVIREYQYAVGRIFNSWGRGREVCVRIREVASTELIPNEFDVE
jgi:hypothetical protein